MPRRATVTRPPTTVPVSITAARINLILIRIAARKPSPQLHGSSTVRASSDLEHARWWWNGVLRKFGDFFEISDPVDVLPLLARTGKKYLTGNFSGDFDRRRARENRAATEVNYLAHVEGYRFWRIVIHLFDIDCMDQTSTFQWLSFDAWRNKRAHIIYCSLTGDVATFASRFGKCRRQTREAPL